MAEAIGVVASSVAIGTLAAQITSSVVKLKSYWDQVYDAPEDIRDLMEQVDHFNNVLAHIEDDQRRNPFPSVIRVGTSLSNCLQLCRKAAGRLKQLTEDLRADLDAGNKLRRKQGSVKVVLQKEKIKKYKKKMEWAISLLGLSYQFYNGASMQLQLDIVVGQLSHITTPSAVHTRIYSSTCQIPSDSNTQLTQGAADPLTVVLGKSSGPSPPWTVSTLLGSIRYSKRCCSFTKSWRMDGIDRTEESEEFIAQYRAPVWLVSRAWELQVSKATSGWKFRPSTFDVIPSSSLVFTYASDGYIEGLQELFWQKKASPYDCDEDGYTALHCASRHNRYSTCKFLIKQGADVDRHSHDIQLTPAHMQFLIYNEDARTSKSNKAILDTTRLFLCESDLEPLHGLYSFCLETFTLWQQLIYPLYYELPLQERVGIAIGVSPFAPWRRKSEVFRAALTRDIFPAPAMSIRDSRERTLLHTVAATVGSWSQGHLIPGNPEYGLVTGWRRMLRELILEGADHHSISRESRTPLLDLIAECFNYTSAVIEGLPQLLFAFWVEELDKCGVDLEQYGRTETELFEQGTVSWYFLDQGACPCISKPKMLRLASLTYGRQPSRCRITLEECQHPLADELERSIPGGWVEENDSLPNHSLSDESLSAGCMG